MAKKTKEKPKEITIETNTRALLGSYSNAVKIMVGNNDVLIDFAFVYPNGEQSEEGVMHSRIITTRQMAKKLADRLYAELKETDK